MPLLEKIPNFPSPKELRFGADPQFAPPRKKFIFLLDKGATTLYNCPIERKGKIKMGNIAKGLTVFDTALTFINSIAKIIGFNDQSWLEIIFPFVGFIVCMVILTEAKKHLKEKEEVEEYFEYY